MHISLFVAQKNLSFNNKLADNDKASKAFMKPKAQPKTMPKGKEKQKQLDTLEIKKMNWQIDKNFVIKKLTQSFNLEDKNASLQAKVT